MVWAGRMLKAVRGLQCAAIAVLADSHAKHEIGAIVYFVALLILLGLFVSEYVLDELHRAQENDVAREHREQAEKLERHYQSERAASVVANNAVRARLESSLNIANAGVAFLVSTYRQTTRAIASQKRSTDSGTLLVRDIKKFQIIVDALRNMCHAVKESASLERNVPISDVIVKATFMEIVTAASGHQQLEYRAWCTPSDAPPRSASEQKTFEKREGCAGLAWHRQRPVIEHEFTGEEWTDNYKDQGDIYRTQNMSMISVPVVRLDDHTVLGVITVDINLKEFFGQKNQKDAEERAGRWFLPYTTYISFIYAAEQFASTVFPILAAGLTQARTLAGAHSHELLPTAPEPASSQ